MAVCAAPRIGDARQTSPKLTASVRVCPGPKTPFQNSHPYTPRPPLAYRMRLYRVETECRKCFHRHRDWITEAQRAGAFTVPPEEVVGVRECPRSNCRRPVPVLSRNVRDSWFDAHMTATAAKDPLLRNLRLRPNLTTPAAGLPERQAQICALVLEGMTDRRIAALLGIGKPTLRKEIQAAARTLCSTEPIACRVFPRQTIVAYYQKKAGSTEPAHLFARLHA